MAQYESGFVGLEGVLENTSTSTAYVLRVPSLERAILTNDPFRFIITPSNGDNPTITINGSAAINLVDTDLNNLTTGTYPNNTIVEGYYNGTQFVCTNYEVDLQLLPAYLF